ncbi:MULTISPECIES: YjgN family protein [unclassified Marinovum]
MQETSPWERASPDTGAAPPADLSPQHTPDWPPPGSYASSTPPEALDTAFAGTRRAVFWLALKTGILTVLTLGLYRFWMKTRLRRWYWSSTRPGGTPLEYVGDPYEKLLGFLIAVVILAFYIGVVNLILMFVSFALFQQSFAAYLLSFLGVIPLWFYASYRARRYVLARTRWRGVRFGMAPGAWGYVWRALLHWAITLVTLGLLWPRMTFWLEKYRTDRTYFGDARLQQGGRWTMLYRATRPMFLAVALAAAATGLGFGGAPAASAAVSVAAMLSALYGFVYYRVETKRLLTNHKSAAGVRLHARPSTFRILMITVFGYLVTVLILAVPLGILALGITLVQFAQTDLAQDLGDLGTLAAAVPSAVLVALGIALYFAIFLLWATFTHAWVTMPIWRHYATTLTIVNPEALRSISQRARDEFEEAEGFAEALDVGASI